MIRIGFFFSPWDRTRHSTGVGRHALEMVRAIGSRDDVTLSLVASQSDCHVAEAIAAERIGDAVVHRLPGGDRLTRLMFIGARCLPVDRWVDGVDWLYCSKEQPVACRNVRLAVNVHDILTVEPQIDGLNNRPPWQSRWRWSQSLKRIRRADLVTTVSEFTKGRLVERFQFDPDRIVVVGNGVSDLYFREPQESDLDVLEKYDVRPQEYFFSSGSLTRRKGGDLLMAAGRLLKDAGHQVPILLSGRRHDRDLLQEYEAASATEPDRPLRLLGYIPDADQAVLLSHALALAFPSRYEGFGIPALEAMAAGTIAVCSRIPALAEVAGESGLFVEPNSAGQLADVMRCLINGDVDRERYVVEGRRRAAEFRWAHCAERLVNAMHGPAGGTTAQRASANLSVNQPAGETSV